MSVRHLKALFRGDRLVVLGAPGTASQRQLLRNLQACRPPEQHPQLTGAYRPAELPRASVAVVFDGQALGSEHLEVLAAGGCKALLWADHSPPDAELLQALRPQGLRLLGPRSAGLIHTGHGLNLSTLPLMPPTGAVALIAQSQSVTAAALDWALGRSVGFSWLATTGVELDIDVADLLDYAALDPDTRAVVLQLSHIGQARKFMSAARAAARVKPVLVLQTRRFSELEAPSPDPVRSAAFRRAGLVECDTLGGLFEGLAALQLLPSLPGERIAVVGNGAGVCALASDAVRRQGLSLAVLSASTLAAIAALQPAARFAGGAVDLGSADPKAILAVLRLLLAEPGVGPLLLVHSPTAWPSHRALGELLAGAGLGERLLTVWLGLYSAQAARQHSAEAGLASFASAEEALRAIHYRLQHQRNRELLGQTPPAEPALEVDGAAVGRWLKTLCRADSTELAVPDSLQLLGRYGLSGQAALADTAHTLCLQAQRHPELGMVLSLRRSTDANPEYALPPLDELLARRLLQSAGGAAAGAVEPPAIVSAAMTASLIRLGRLLIEQPLIQRLQLRLAWTEAGHLAPAQEPRLELVDPPRPERQRIALAAYPAALAHEARLPGGERYRVRAVRASDEPAVLRLLARLDPEEIRLRFFAQIRHFTHDMAARITQVDYDRELSLVASALAEPGEIAAIATLVADADGRDAEYAVLVHHDHARLGLGRHLLDRLLQIARQRGIARVHGDVLAINTPMLGLARSLGFRTHLIWDDPGSRKVEIDTTGYPSPSAGAATAVPAA